MQNRIAQVRLDLDHHVGPIDRRIFGGFLEHLGRAIYGGVYDPGNPLSDEAGFRRDVLDALRSLDMPVVRYPGGNFVSAYDWRDGVGPREERRARPDFAWKSIEPNTFGVDEFLAWCRRLGTDPYMVVNLGTGSPRDAAELVEYCNLPGGTYWSDRRAAHGHPEPYGIRLWGLGNEMDGPWQAGHVSADVYARRARVAAQLMKGLDPTLELVAVGSTMPHMATYMEWDRVVLEECWDQVDYLATHHYSRNVPDDPPAFLAMGVEIDEILQDYAGLFRYVKARRKSSKNLYLSFDEWNVWYRTHDRDRPWWRQAPALLEEVYDLQDALVVAQYLNSFIRHADVVKIACLAQLVNVIPAVLTSAQGLLVQSIYHPFALWSRHARGISVTPVVDGPTYDAGSRGEAPVLDAAAAYDPEARRMTLFLVNRSLDEALTVDVAVSGLAWGAVETAHALTGDRLDAANTWEQPQAVRPTPGAARIAENGALRIVVPARGLSVVAAPLVEGASGSVSGDGSGVRHVVVGSAAESGG